MWKAGKKVLIWDLGTENNIGRQAKSLLDSPVVAART